MTEDARDLSAARAGDHLAFARLYDRHAAVVFSLCRSRCARDAEDAVQETFIRAYKMLTQLEGAHKLRPWLYAIARRVCAERSRAARRRNHHEDHAVMFRALTSDITNPPADSVHQTERLARLTSAINLLPDNQRLAIHLFYLEDDPTAAAASAMKLSRSGFYKLLARARTRLATHMREVPTP